MSSIEGIKSEIDDHFDTIIGQLNDQKAIVSTIVQAHTGNLLNQINNLQRQIADLSDVKAENLQLKSALDAAYKENVTGKSVNGDRLQESLEKCKDDFLKCNTARVVILKQCRIYKSAYDKLRKHCARSTLVTRDAIQSLLQTDLEDSERYLCKRLQTLNTIIDEAAIRQRNMSFLNVEKDEHLSPKRHADNAEHATLANNVPNSSAQTEDTANAETLATVGGYDEGETVAGYDQKTSSQELEYEHSSPVVVSERPVKKANRSRAARLSAQMPKIKQEIVSSSPSGVQELSSDLCLRGERSDSLDLDEMEGTLMTPRRSVRLQKTTFFDRATPVHENAGITTGGLGSCQSANHIKSPATAIKRSFPHDVHQDKSMLESPEGAITPVYSNADKAVISTTISAESTRLERSEGFSPQQRKEGNLNGRSKTSFHSIAVVTEDGEEHQPQIPANSLAGTKRQSFAVPETKNKHQRLDSLLQGKGPTQPALLVSNEAEQSRSKIQTQSFAPSDLSSTSHTLRSDYRTPAHRRSSKAQLRDARAMTAQNSSKSPSPSTTKSMNPDDEPLRTRPAHRLCLEDFRLNPKHSNYAYHESLRRHDDRKARSGCTDPFCVRCKDMLDFVAATSPSIAQPRRDQDSAWMNVSAADRKLLQAYLGTEPDDAESTSKGDRIETWRRLSHMSPDKLNTMLLRARTKAFADKFGKHRQGNSRVAEPPGFWDTEFPSTQEDVALRAEAKKMQSRQVEERRAEALRGGMWVFADELERK